MQQSWLKPKRHLSYRYQLHHLHHRHHRHRRHRRHRRRRRHRRHRRHQDEDRIILMGTRTRSGASYSCARRAASRRARRR